MMDGNAWLGHKIISTDKHPQNSNGKLFESFLIKYPNMTLLNGSSVCEGNITRVRKVNTNKWEESILDFMIVCDKILPFVTKLVIDEKKVYSFMRYANRSKRNQPLLSDHNSLILKLDLEIRKPPPQRTTRFKFKDNLAMVNFNKTTTNTQNFTKCFSTNEPFEKQTEKWMSELNSHIHRNFKKYRVTKKFSHSKATHLFVKIKYALKTGKL